MDKIDQQYLNEIAGGTESGDVESQHDLKVHEENTTIEELEVSFRAKNNNYLMININTQPNESYIVFITCCNSLYNPPYSL